MQSRVKLMWSPRYAMFSHCLRAERGTEALKKCNLENSPVACLMPSESTHMRAEVRTFNSLEREGLIRRFLD